MKVAIPLSLALLLSVQTAAAQSTAPPPKGHIDTVTVEAPKTPLERAVNSFVKSYAQPTALIGKLARWSVEPLCPLAVGLSPDMNVFVSERIRVVAKMVGAPVARNVPCASNITVLFTPHPQALLDSIRSGPSDLLGFHYVAQLDAITKASHPIQAWYVTATRDYNGIIRADDAQAFDRCLDQAYGTEGQDVVASFQVCRANTEGMLIKDGEHSELTAVTVVVDVPKIAGLQIGAVADYIAMLALSQTESFETCQPLASITNLMTPNCDAPKAQALTEADAAYLKALYKVSPDILGQFQVIEIAHEMEAALGAH